MTIVIKSVSSVSVKYAQTERIDSRFRNTLVPLLRRGECIRSLDASLAIE